ncbi:MAG: citramalate synthase [Methanobacteriota archaeon]|nr:MAG: citramalate synthase [Euryarchaeota archaeon]
MVIKLYDTTLRDGAQSERISFSVEDKLRIAEKLDELGIHYIEGGWPGSNPKDAEFFQRAGSLDLKAEVVPFGSTRRAGVKAGEDLNLKALLDAETDVVCIFGKSWDLHVKEALRTSLEENLAMIGESVAYLKDAGREVIYDAEHFFDAYKDNPDYALKTLKAAEEVGADVLVLCDTNGGTMPFEVEGIVKAVRKEVKTPLGIHAHNDSDMAVANTIAAVRLGVGHVQGTINGYGERCGNANLCSIIPNLKLKMGLDCLSDDRLKRLTEVSRYVSEIANLSPQPNLPYVGSSAFAHKGGVHVDAVSKNPRTYEHVEPEVVGNTQRVLVSELSGRANVVSKARELGFSLEKSTRETEEILRLLKEKEKEGYQYEGAEASFELLIREALNSNHRFFDLEGFRVIVERQRDGRMLAEATVRVKVGDEELFMAAEGDGPVNALDMALRKALYSFYPSLREMHLRDYKVRVLDEKRGTAAKVRVLVESGDMTGTWGTVGVSENIIEASFEALVDSIVYKLLRDSKRQ